MDNYPYFTSRSLEIIGSIPPGRVTSYGKVAALAGNPRGARQVARLLHGMSQKYSLPWHRVVNREGRISLPVDSGFLRQKELLEHEGVSVTPDGRIDMKKYGWPVGAFKLP